MSQLQDFLPSCTGRRSPASAAIFAVLLLALTGSAPDALAGHDIELRIDTVIETSDISWLLPGSLYPVVVALHSNTPGFGLPWGGPVTYRHPGWIGVPASWSLDLATVVAGTNAWSASNTGVYPYPFEQVEIHLVGKGGDPNTIVPDFSTIDFTRSWGVRDSVGGSRVTVSIEAVEIVYLR